MSIPNEDIINEFNVNALPAQEENHREPVLFSLVRNHTGLSMLRQLSPIINLVQVESLLARNQASALYSLVNIVAPAHQAPLVQAQDNDMHEENRHANRAAPAA